MSGLGRISDKPERRLSPPQPEVQASYKTLESDPNLFESDSSGWTLTFGPLTSGAGILPASNAKAAEMLAFRFLRMAGGTPASLMVDGSHLSDLQH